MGQSVTVALRMRHFISNLEGLIKRREGTQFGIFFPASIRHEEQNPPNSLWRIFNDLERGYLASRSG